MCQDHIKSDGFIPSVYNELFKPPAPPSTVSGLMVAQASTAAGTLVPVEDGSDDSHGPFDFDPSAFEASGGSGSERVNRLEARVEAAIGKYFADCAFRGVPIPKADADEGETALRWWREVGRTEHPLLVPLVLRYLCIAPTTGETERFFKVSAMGVHLWSWLRSLLFRRRPSTSYMAPTCLTKPSK